MTETINEVKTLLRQVRIGYVKIERGERYYAFGTVCDVSPESEISVLIPRKIVLSANIEIGQIRPMFISSRNPKGEVLEDGRWLAHSVASDKDNPPFDLKHYAEDNQWADGPTEREHVRLGRLERICRELRDDLTSLTEEIDDLNDLNEEGRECIKEIRRALAEISKDLDQLKRLNDVENSDV